MVKKHLSKIFLSASIPYPERDKRFYNTVDIVAIRDSVRALATVVIPRAHLVWGGHPSITPLIRYVMNRMNSDVKKHITLYQSNFFKDDFPKDNFHFEAIEIVKEAKDKDSSLLKMRREMLAKNNFSVGIFVGGMEGVIDEYELFRKYQPEALILPIASTGGAAKIIFDEIKPQLDNRLLNDYAYMALFRKLLFTYL
jgi:hypothetical protein